MRHTPRRWPAVPAALVLLAVCAALFAPEAALAVPRADHVRFDLAALRLCVNDFSVRYQVKVICIVTSSEENGLERVKEAELTVTSPSGAAVSLKPRSADISPKRFKAATAKLLFKAIDDSASKALSNVPSGFLTAPGEYSAKLTLRGESYYARFSFGAPVSLTAEQDGVRVEHFSLKDEEPLDIFTQPREFGPVYYKRQDFTNFMFMLNNMDQAIESKDYHPEVESPMYIFQVRVGDSNGGPTRLLDPGKYIAGHQEFLIRSDMTSTPLRFGADEFNPGEVVIVDFMRQDTLKPDEGLSGPADGFSGQIVTQNRVVYAMAIETAPTASELGALAGATEAEATDK
jgi:hypothetical protein